MRSEILCNSAFLVENVSFDVLFQFVEQVQEDELLSIKGESDRRNSDTLLLKRADDKTINEVQKQLQELAVDRGLNTESKKGQGCDSARAQETDPGKIQAKVLPQAFTAKDVAAKIISSKDSVTKGKEISAKDITFKEVGKEKTLRVAAKENIASTNVKRDESRTKSQNGTVVNSCEKGSPAKHTPVNNTVNNITNKNKDKGNTVT